MKTREETARYVEHQFDAYSDYECPLAKPHCHHYGKQDVRALLDFIYEGPPDSKPQEVRGKNLRNGHRV